MTFGTRYGTVVWGRCFNAKFPCNGKSQIFGFAPKSKAVFKTVCTVCSTVWYRTCYSK